jgi:hypothetical protein
MRKPPQAKCVRVREAAAAAWTSVRALMTNQWNWFIVLIALAAALKFPFDAAFRPAGRLCSGSLCQCFGWWFGYALDVLYGVDVLLRLCSATLCHR